MPAPGLSNCISTQDSIIFRGICDGSAAVKLDDKTILVAYDELNALFSFNLTGGKAVASIELAAMLNLKTSDEIDIEAATVSGQQIWWIGSHSREKNGGGAPNRRMLFATNIPGADLSDLKLVSQPIDLIEVLLKSEKIAKVLMETARNRLPKEGGINIEGLAATADDGLLVAFRSPLNGKNGTSGDALIARILPNGESFEVQQLYFIDLDNRGIREIHDYGNGYMIIAGPVASGGEFALYTWDGESSPQQLGKLNDLNAEAIISMGDYWLILSDDGKVLRADNEASDGYRKCDRIRSKNSSGGAHPSVYFHARKFSK